jgi:hypothetical protein
MRRILKKSVAKLLSALMSIGALWESTPTIRADSPATESSPCPETALQFRPIPREPFESSIEHSEREDYSRDGWSDARQTVPFVVSGAVTSRFNLPIEIVAPNWSEMRRAEKILRDCVRRWQ